MTLPAYAARASAGCGVGRRMPPSIFAGERERGSRVTRPEGERRGRGTRQVPRGEYPQPPVPGEAVAYVELEALPTAPKWGRSLVNMALRAWRLWPETIETTELLVSELVTNAAMVSGPGSHARLRYGDLAAVARISLTLRHLPGRVVIEVFDHDQNPPVLDDAGTDAESGRGLLLVEALSKEWGHFFPPSGGKVVYAIVST
ncbi:MAG TPA: ATP-binding protein [Streptosporangiaceae bacterium]|nr:ATP-binding protein [Streptosporangiaceae bacterium]